MYTGSTPRSGRSSLWTARTLPTCSSGNSWERAIPAWSSTAAKYVVADARMQCRRVGQGVHPPTSPTVVCADVTRALRPVTASLPRLAPAVPKKPRTKATATKRWPTSRAASARSSSRRPCWRAAWTSSCSTWSSTTTCPTTWRTTCTDADALDAVRAVGAGTLEAPCIETGGLTRRCERRSLQRAPRAMRTRSSPLSRKSMLATLSRRWRCPRCLSPRTCKRWRTVRFASSMCGARRTWSLTGTCKNLFLWGVAKKTSVQEKGRGRRGALPRKRVFRQGAAPDRDGARHDEADAAPGTSLGTLARARVWGWIFDCAALGSDHRAHVVDPGTRHRRTAARRARRRTRKRRRRKRSSPRTASSSARARS